MEEEVVKEEEDVEDMEEGTEEEVVDDEAGGKEEVVDVGTCNEGESAK